MESDGGRSGYQNGNQKTTLLKGLKKKRQNQLGSSYNWRSAMLKTSAGQNLNINRLSEL